MKNKTKEVVLALREAIIKGVRKVLASIERHLRDNFQAMLWLEDHLRETS